MFYRRAAAPVGTCLPWHGPPAPPTVGLDDQVAGEGGPRPVIRGCARYAVDFRLKNGVVSWLCFAHSD